VRSVGVTNKAEYNKLTKHESAAYLGVVASGRHVDPVAAVLAFRFVGSKRAAFCGGGRALPR
jgi:hypothetical protein